MNQKRLSEKLIKIANTISKNRKPKANYIQLSEEFIQSQADIFGVSFNEMVTIIKNELS